MKVLIACEESIADAMAEQWGSLSPEAGGNEKMDVEKVKLSKENEQFLFLQCLFGSLIDSVVVFAANGGHDVRSANYGNKGHSKTAIKRKITLLRQELLNLGRMLDND